MNAINRARHAAQLCCHFARNFAYYSVLRSSSLLSQEGFWLTVCGNFVDVCVLEWCKLFGNRNGKCHWKRVMPNPEMFQQRLLLFHGIDNLALHELWSEVKGYRDDFVAHIIEVDATLVPNLTLPYLLVGFYFRALKAEFFALEADTSLPLYLDQYYDQCLTEAQGVLQQTNGLRNS